MNIEKIQKDIEKGKNASTIDKISVASILFLSDSLFFELMQEFKEKKGLDGNDVIYKIIRLFGGMTITVPSSNICTIYEYMTRKSSAIQNGLISPEHYTIFINQMREALNLNSSITDSYLISIIKKYKNLLTREHIVNAFEEQVESEAAWTKSIAKLKKIKILK